MKKDVFPDIYDGRDPRKVPNYSYAEAARYLRLPSSTLRSWIKGRKYIYMEEVSFSKPLIPQEETKISFLSFEHLIEAHIIRALRKIHQVSMKSRYNNGYGL